MRAWDHESRSAELGKTLVLAVVIALFVRVGIAQAYLVDGRSMEPSLADHQRLLVLRAAYGLSLPGRSEAVATWSTPSLGDVVVLESPADGLDLVKRVVGLPGDVVEVRRGQIYRNGRPIERTDLGSCDPSARSLPGCVLVEERSGDRHWLTRQSRFDAGPDVGPLWVPEGHVFVMGDHRDRSNDSRAFGPVPIDHLRGRVLLVD